MKKLANKYFLVLLGIILIIPAQAQLFNQYKNKMGGIIYPQFPIQKERKNMLTLEVIEKNMIGTAAKNVIKNEKIAGALTGKGGVLADESTINETELIPIVFPTDGNLLAEVYFSDWTSDKDNIKLEKVFHRWVEKGESIEAIVSYKLYSIPGKKLIFTQEPIWVNSYVPNSSGMPLTGNQLQAALKSTAKTWAKEQIKNNFGLHYKSINIPVYTIKGVDKDEKKQAEEIQEKIIELMSSYKYNNKDSKYTKNVNECIGFWENQLKNYKPGTTKKKESIINDKNAWCLFYNIAIANVLLDNESKARKNINKALALKKVKTKDIVNKKGEKKGEVKTMFSPKEQSYLAELDEMIDVYYAGIKANNPKFVDFVVSREKRKKASLFAREYATNLYLSEAFDLKVPVGFTCRNLRNDQPKSIEGKINDDKNNINYTLKKSILYFATHKYIANIANSDNSIKTKQKYSSNLLPYKYNVSFRLPYQITHYKVKTSSKDNWEASSLIQYDYNGDILINNIMLKDKWAFMGWCKITETDALKVQQSTYRIKHNDYVTTSITKETQKIEREREIKFFSAYIQKLLSTEPLETKEISRNTNSEKYNYNTDKIIISGNGNSESLAFSVDKDDKANWIKVISGNQKVTRNIVY
ncbi:MAG: hypothetical protein U9R42_04925 [Bacteroidota bacterium]|nr:hypothetical protein [Bacteroidota bacterium]